MKLETLLGFICRLMKRLRWHNDPVGYARSIGVRVGKNCRFANVKFGSEPYLITLGDWVAATNTRFVTHDGGIAAFRDRYPNMDIIAPIKVGNNVFFGSGVIVLPGVTIGDNVIIGAGAIVAKDIPSNCVAIGIPARKIKSIDEYFKSAEEKMIPTAKMPKKAKRDYLLNYFKVE